MNKIAALENSVNTLQNSVKLHKKALAHVLGLRSGDGFVLDELNNENDEFQSQLSRALDDNNEIVIKIFLIINIFL